MSNEDESTPKPSEEPKDAAAPRQRKIVRRSVSTRDNPAFNEAPAADPVEAAAAPEGGPAAVTGDAPPPPAPAASATDAPRPRPRATFDARAPRPRPSAGDARPPRPARPPRSSGGGGDYRPPPARPVGARPLPGGSRAPAPEGAGDYRPPPARPIGARPLPGGSRAPAPPGDRRDRRPRPEGDRPARPPADPQARTAPAAPAPAKPAPRPVAAPPPPPAPAKVAAPKPMPVFIPLARAGQVAPASAKPALTPKEALAAKTKAHAPKSASKPAPRPASAPESAPAFDAGLVSVGADGAVAALVQAGEAAAALVDAWAAASNGAAIAEAAESDAVSGAARKAARRALNVLRSRGVAVPTRTHVVKMDDRAEVSVEATMISPDGQGSMVIIITSKDASGRYHLGEVILREPFGILQAASGWLSGSQIKESRTRALEGYGVAPVPVPVPWARHRIAAARMLNASSGQVLPLGLERCGELLEPVPEAAPPHPVADLEADLSSDHARAVAVGSARLHEEPEFRGWFPDSRALDELLRKVGEHMGQGDRGQEAFDTALHAETEAATDRFFSPEVRALVASRMRDAAISVRSRKGDRAAAEVVGVARAVLEAGLITAPPREIPFLVRFFEKGIAYLAQQGGGQLRIPVAAPQPSEAPPA